MERNTENLDGTWKKISDGACYAQVRGGSGLGQFVPGNGQPDADDDTYLQLSNIDYPGPEPLYCREQEGGESVIVWKKP